MYGFEPEEKVLKRYNKEDELGRFRYIDLRKQVIVISVKTDLICFITFCIIRIQMIFTPHLMIPFQVVTYKLNQRKMMRVMVDGELN